MSSESNEQLRPLIIDIGSNTFRLGWASDDFPDIIVPSVYVDINDYLFTSEVIDGLEDIFINRENVENHLFGSDALKYQNILKIHEFKKENNFTILTKFFYYYYQQLKISNEYRFKQPIIVITPFFMPDLTQKKLKEIFFDIFGFPSILFLSETQAILSTLQKTSGVVLNMGESNTYISTIFHGFTNLMARDIFPIAGKDLTNYLLNMILTKKSSEKAIYLDYMTAKEIKERLSLCVLDPAGEIKRVKDGLTIYNRNVNLPDGSNLEINFERFMLIEPLFNPTLIHIDYIGLGETVANVIKTWDRENWEDLVSSIILSGGGSLVSGLDKRLELNLSKYFSPKIKDKIKVTAASGRENMGWIGASILYSQGKLKKGWEHNSTSKGQKLESNNQN
jgi:actin